MKNSTLIHLTKHAETQTEFEKTGKQKELEQTILKLSSENEKLVTMDELMLDFGSE